MKTFIQFLTKESTVSVAIMLLLVIGISSCKKDEDNPPDENSTMVSYSGNFVKSGDNVTTSASGTTTATFNTSTRELTYKLTWTGLGSNAVGMHFHDNGPVIVGIDNFPNGVSGSVSGKATLTVEQASDLAAGKIYSQIHTENYPGGEIIATLAKSNNPSNPPGGGGGGYDY